MWISGADGPYPLIGALVDRFAPNRDAGSVSRHRNPDTRRRVADTTGWRCDCSSCWRPAPRELRSRDKAALRREVADYVN